MLKSASYNDTFEDFYARNWDSSQTLQSVMKILKFLKLKHLRNILTAKPAIMRIVVAECFEISASIYFFKRSPNQHHSLKFSLNILYEVKENHSNFQRMTFSSFSCKKVSMSGSLQRPWACGREEERPPPLELKIVSAAPPQKFWMVRKSLCQGWWIEIRKCRESKNECVLYRLSSF